MKITETKQRWRRIKVARKGTHGGQYAYTFSGDDSGMPSLLGAYATIRRTGFCARQWNWCATVGRTAEGVRKGSCRTLVEAKAAASLALRGMQ